VDNERQRKALRLFDELADTPQEAWNERLDALCADDPDVRAEALALLEADRQAVAVTGLANQAPHLLAGVVDSHETAVSAKFIGQRIGPWRLQRELGRGGMGAVWLAERVDGAFEQTVAIKLIRPGWDVEDILSRFRSERQILAGLNHPHIARLVDGGVTEDGKPWLALEYVDGENLSTYCRVQNLSVTAKLKLVLTVCEAMAYAHARLIVHRDLKPSNILVTRDGTVKLLDFGIAKLLDSEAAAATGTRVFTPEYAAPEQVRGDPITTSVDVYALGLLTYDLLTGACPYKLDKPTPAAYQRAVLEQQPTRPSQAVAGSGTTIEVATLRRSLRGDLDAIVLKTLRKEPEQRYVSVNAFAADIQAYLEQRPVSARRGGRRYRLQRFVRRHATAVGLSIAAVFALIAGAAVALWQAREAREQRDAAEVETRRARATTAFLESIFDNAEPEHSGEPDIRVSELLERADSTLEKSLPEDPATRSALLLSLARAHLGVGSRKKTYEMTANALALRRNDSPAALREALMLHASALNYAKLYEKARPFVEELLTLKDIPGTDVATLARIYSIAGVIHMNLGDDAKAEVELRSAFELYREQEGPGGPGVVNVTTMLSHLLMDSDRYEEAETLVRPVLAAVAELPDQQASVGPMSGTLGLITSKLGKSQEAIALLRSAVADKAKIYGENHQDYATVLNNLAIVLRDAGEYDESLQSLERVLAIRRSLWGEDHRALALTYMNIGNVYVAADRPREAAAPLQHALSIFEKSGEDGATQARARYHLATALARAGRLDESRGLIKTALGQLQRVYPNGNSWIARALAESVSLDLLDSAPSADCAAAERAAMLLHGRMFQGQQAYASGVFGACLLAKGESARGAALLGSARDTLESMGARSISELHMLERVTEAAKRAEAQSARPAATKQALPAAPAIQAIHGTPTKPAEDRSKT